MCQQNSAAPNTPHEIPYLALFRQPKGPFKPSTFGKIESSFTNTSSITIFPVTETFKLNFPSIVGADKPGVFFSRINPLIFPLWAEDFAQITKTSAMGLLEIQDFSPEIL